MGKRHKVGLGDCMSTIAFAHGFKPEALWNHPDNAELRERRRHAQVLARGDVVVIPDRAEREESCHTGSAYRFVQRAIPERLHLVFHDADGKARVGVPYVLVVGEARYEGSTGPQGEIKHPIPLDVDRGTLTLGDDEEYELELGHLEPETEPEGVIERLRALGYVPEGLADSSTFHLGRAVIDFQVDQGIEPATGEIDAKTLDALVKAYGC